jgi:deoxycytidylate deaminase
MCAKKIVNAGIDEVIYLERYEQSNGIDILIDAGIKVRKF